MSTTKISRRYAVALFDLIQDGVLLLPALREAAELSVSSEVGYVFDSSSYPNEVKCSIFDKVLTGDGREEVLRLVELLIQRGKISLLSEILSELELMIVRAGSSVDVEVTTAIKLGAAGVASLVKSLGAQTGKKVNVVAYEDPAIIGGVVIRMGDRKIDCSVKSKLDGMKRAIIG